MTETITQTLPLGVSIAQGETRLRVWAPHAKAVAVTGSFNDWNEKGIALEPSEDAGFWQLSTKKISVGDEYQYVITGPNDERLMRNDPRARLLTNSSGNTIVTEDDFDWGDDSYQIPAWNELVIYEMHVGTFNVVEAGRPGTFLTAIERLDYLKDLGINLIEVMPVAEFAGDFSWGYNPAYPFSVEEAYGGPTGLKQFVKEAHARGMGVVMDVVYNHFGPSDMSMWQFDGWHENDKGGIYFYNDWRSNTPWGDTRPDYGRDEVRWYIHDNALMWLEDYRCDGLRMDMIPYIRNVSGGEGEDGNLEDGYSLLKWLNETIHAKYPHKITIAEDLHGNNFVTDPTALGGLGYGAQWDGDFVHPVRKTLLEFEDQYRDMDVVSTALLRRYGDDAFSRVVYTESHDEVSNGKARVVEEISGDGEDVNSYHSVKRAMLGSMLALTAPGIPMLFQGQALLEDKWFSDQDPLDWSRLKDYNGIYHMYRDVIALRRNLGGLSKGLHGQHTQLIHLHHDNKIIAYLRWFEDPAADGVLVVLNFSNQSFENYGIGLDQQNTWRLNYNSDWKGYSEVNADVPANEYVTTEAQEVDGRPHRLGINLGPYGGYIYTPAGREEKTEEAA